MDYWRELTTGPNPPEEIHVVVESPKGTENKDQYDTSKTAIVLDRVLYSAMHYPGGYGFIPRTLDEDQDPLDMLVLVTNSTFPGCILTARPIGLLRMEGDSIRDDKVLAVPTNDPRFNEYFELDDPPQHILDEIAYLFETYKTPEGKHVHILGWEGSQEAMEAVRRCQKSFMEYQ
jgi:inorganic pyrophosphatase